MKNNIIRKIFSIIGMLLLVSSVSAQTLDLANYPEFFLKDEKFNGEIVVGETAHAMDTLAAFNLADNLRNKEVEVFKTGKSVRENIPIGSPITTKISQELADIEVEGLLDTKISFQNEEYDVSELIILGQRGNNLSIESSLTASEDDYQTDIVLEISKDAIKYYYNFDETIDLSETSNNNPLTIEILGKKIKIINIVSDTKFTAFTGKEYFMNVDEEIVVDEKTVKLLNVGQSGVVLVDVEGIVETIPSGQTEKVNGLEINNHETFYTYDKEERSAVLIIGKNALVTYSDSDPFIGEDKNDPDWVWNIGNLKTKSSSNPTILSDGTGPYIGIENDFVWNDDSDNPIKIGEEIKLPFGYVGIKLEQFTVKNENYKSYSIEYENAADLSDALGDQFSKVKTVLITTQKDEGLVIKSSLLSTPNITKDVKTNKIWLYGEDANNLDVLYLDKNDRKIKLAGKITNDSLVKFGEINYGNTKGDDISIKANFSPLNSQLTITLNPATADITNDNIDIVFGLDSYTIQALGTTLNKEETNEVKWNNNNIGMKDEDLRTKYGIIIRDPRSHGSDDQVELEIPNNELQVTVVIYGRNTKIEKEIIKIAEIPRISLDTEVTINNNLILIGGPAVNSKVAELLNIEFPSYGTTDNFNIKEKEAMIKLMEKDKNNYLIIAGYNKEDTEKAVNIMANFNNYKNLLKGKTEIIINVDNLKIKE